MSIETQVTELIEATTGLLDAVNVRKAILDDRADTAVDAADRAEDAADRVDAAVEGIPVRLDAVEWFNADLANATDPEKGAGIVGYRGRNVADALDEGVLSDAGARNMRAILDSASPVGELPQNVLLRKLRDDYFEFACYTPITSDGREWARWLFSSRFNGGAQLPAEIANCRMVLCTRSFLYKGLALAGYSDNRASETEGQAPVQTLATADATDRTGTWTAAATIGSTSDSRYTTVTGDSVTYSLTGVQRIALRVYASVPLGAIGDVVVRDSGGVEIDAGNYLLPLVSGSRVADQPAAANGVGAGTSLIPVADGLPLGNYTVTVTRSGSSDAAARLYDSGCRGYLETEYDAEGYHGIFAFNVTLGVPVANNPGSRVIYAAEGTRFAYHHARGNNAGQFAYRIFDASGDEIPESNYNYPSKTVDAYSPKIPFLAETLLASDLPFGSYFVEVTSLNTRNAASSGYRLYDNGIVQYDEREAGVLGSDPFDDSGMTNSFGSLNTDVPDGAMFMGGGNSEVAIEVRDPGTGVFEFVGGVHKAESSPQGFAVRSLGLDFGYAEAAALTEWILPSVDVQFSTDLYYYNTVTKWAEMGYKYRLSPYGYVPTITRTVTVASYVKNDYVNMMLWPKSTGPVQYGNKGVLNGFPNVALDTVGNYSFGSDENSTINISQLCRGCVAFNSYYAVGSFTPNAAQYRSLYYETDGGGSPGLTSLNNRSDGAGKFYGRAFLFDASAGRELQSGDIMTRSTVYRVIKSAGADSLFV